MNTTGIIAAITPIVTAFEQLRIEYHIGGSVVSSVYEIPRATFDVDIIANLRPVHVRSLVKQLEAAYYIDEDMIRDAINLHSEFNIIHLETMLKVDIFIPKPRAFEQEEFKRIRQEVLVAQGERSFGTSASGGRLRLVAGKGETLLAFSVLPIVLQLE